MWSRLSNLAQNVQTGLDTVVDNVNKSMTEEEAAAAAAATEEVKITCTVHKDKKKESPYSLGHSKYVTWSRGMSQMSGILILSYRLKEVTNSYVFHCF